MSTNVATNNPWFKLTIVSIAGIIVLYLALWGINTFTGSAGYGNQNMTNPYQMNGMQMQPQTNMQGQMNMGTMNMQGSMNGSYQMQGGMNMQDKGMMNGMGMMGGMHNNQGGMGMM